MRTMIIGIICLLALVALQWSTKFGAFIRRRIYCQRGSTQTEGNRLNDILKYEQGDNFSREVVILATGQNLAVGAVLGKKTKGACPTTGTAVSGVTGAGTMTGVTAGAKAKAGLYTAKCIIAASGAGIFSVEDPDGFALPNAIVAVAYVNDQINFTLNDGSPDFAVGDTFTVTIAAGDGDVSAINFDALDGTQDAYGVLIADCDATSADVDTVAIVRDARVVEANLVWPTTSPAVTTDQKAAAMAQLLAKRIISVVEV